MKAQFIVNDNKVVVENVLEINLHEDDSRLNPYYKVWFIEDGEPISQDFAMEELDSVTA